MIKELQIWVKLKCFSKEPRREAKNIIDTRWVIKYRWDIPTSSSGNTTKTTAVKTIRARLKGRSLRDSCNNDIERYDGTWCQMLTEHLSVRSSHASL